MMLNFGSFLIIRERQSIPFNIADQSVYVNVDSEIPSNVNGDDFHFLLSTWLPAQHSTMPNVKIFDSVISCHIQKMIEI